jgi:hypothetical protein
MPKRGRFEGAPVSTTCEMFVTFVDHRRYELAERSDVRVAPEVGSGAIQLHRLRVARGSTLRTVASNSQGSV